MNQIMNEIQKKYKEEEKRKREKKEGVLNLIKPSPAWVNRDLANCSKLHSVKLAMLTLLVSRAVKGYVRGFNAAILILGRKTTIPFKSFPIRWRGTIHETRATRSNYKV